MSRCVQTSRFAGSTRHCCVWLALCGGIHAQAGSLTVSVKQRNDKPLVGAVITLEAPALPPAPPVTAVMDQVNLAFVPGCAGDPGALERAVSQQRRRQPPGVFVFERAAVPAAAVSRQALSTRGVRPAGRRHARLQHPRQHARLHRGHRRALLRPHRRRRHMDRAESAAGKYSVRVWHPLLNEPQEIERAVQVERRA